VPSLTLPPLSGEGAGGSLSPGQVASACAVPLLPHNDGIGSQFVLHMYCTSPGGGQRQKGRTAHIEVTLFSLRMVVAVCAAAPGIQRRRDATHKGAKTIETSCANGLSSLARSLNERCFCVLKPVEIQPAETAGFGVESKLHATSKLKCNPC